MTSTEDQAKRPRRRVSVRLAGGLALVAIACAGALVARGAGFGALPTGHVGSAGFGTPVDPGPTNVEQALDAVFLARGLDRAGIVARRQAPSDGTRSPDELHVEVPTRDSWAGFNADIARAVEAAGGRVIDAIEKGAFPGRPQALELYIGTPREITHRVVIEPEKPFGSVATAEATKIALVFDDLGYTTDGLAADLLALDVPVTFAVLPGLAKSEAFAKAARARGHEVILHLPMEPLDPDRHRPGPQALLTELPAEENARRLAAQLDGLSLYDGVSNHMGSRVTAAPELMDLVLGELKRRGKSMFFLDSRTTPYSVVPERAHHAGLPCLCNNVFLDGGDEVPALARVQTERLEAIARRRGHAIGIGHVRPATVAAVRTAVERWRTEGIQMVRLSDLVQSR